MAADKEPTLDLDSRRFCSSCKNRMSSLKHDSHSVCVKCRGHDCNLDRRCVECEAWSEDVLKAYVKHRKSLVSKSEKKSLSDSSDHGSRSTPGGTSSSSTSGTLTESKIGEILKDQLSSFRQEIAFSMEASFASFKDYVDEKVDTVANPSFSAPSSVPVDMVPSQDQTDPSVRTLRSGYGPGGETQEPMQTE